MIIHPFFYQVHILVYQPDDAVMVRAYAVARRAALHDAERAQRHFHRLHPLASHGGGKYQAVGLAVISLRVDAVVHGIAFFKELAHAAQHAGGERAVGERKSDERCLVAGIIIFIAPHLFHPFGFLAAGFQAVFLARQPVMLGAEDPLRWQMFRAWLKGSW